MTQNTLSLTKVYAGCQIAIFVSLIAGKLAVPILYRLIFIKKYFIFSNLLLAVDPIT
ncbi:MAG: hypothetical protein ACSLEM_02910 [Candidatus Malihini olakiniferum]